MKKLIFSILLGLSAMLANAQFYAGGSIGIGVMSLKEDGYESATTTALSISPEAGYSFNDVWSAGLTLNFMLQSSDGFDINEIDIMPYVRATFARAGMFDFFGELAMGYGHQSVEGYGTSGFVSALRPGFAANFSEKFALVARTTLLQYNYFDGLSTVGFALNNGFDLGVQFKF